MTATTPAPQVEQVRRRSAARTAPDDTRSALKVITEITAVNIRGRLEAVVQLSLAALLPRSPFAHGIGLSAAVGFLLFLPGKSL